MGIVNKPYTFTALASKSGEAAQVNADLDAIYAEVNGNLDDANVKAAANINQSKILNLTTDLAALSNRKGYEQISAINSTGTSTIEFTGLTSTLYDQYLLTINNAKLSLENTALYLRLRVNGSFLAAASDYGYALLSNSTNDSTPGGEASTTGLGAIPLTTNNQNLSTFGGRTVNGEVRLFGFSASMQKTVMYDIVCFDTTGNVGQIRGMGVVQSVSAPADGIQLVPTALVGTISGQFALYGLKK